MLLKNFQLLNLMPDVNSYDTLRQTILHRFAKSEKKNLTNLFSNVWIEKSTPSKLLRHMSLLKLHLLPENILRRSWLNKQQNNMTRILTP